jgi:hypothetical protein
LHVVLEGDPLLVPSAREVEKVVCNVRGIMDVDKT